MNKYNQFRTWFKAWWQAILFGFILGVITCQAYAYNSIIIDCKVIGAFRIGNTVFACRHSPSGI